MSPEFSAFLSANGTLLVIVIAVLAVVGFVQWRKVRVAEQEHEFKQALIDKGVPVADIEKAVASKAPARRGLMEQFGALSGGGKAGVVVVLVVVISVITGSISSVMHSQTFAEHLRQQHAAAQQPREVTPPPVAPAGPVAGHVFYLDLQPVANHKLADAASAFAALPQARTEFGGVPFQVGPGYVRLRGKNYPDLPAEAKGVRVGFKFDKLHALHATNCGAFGGAGHRFHQPDGTEVGRLRLRYADATEHVIPVVYGQDVRDSWDWDKSRPTTRGRVAWTGTTPAATKEGVSVRLYLTTWENPRPDAEVAHIDYVSAGDTAASPVCIAITAERAAK